jgi:hypothetical protein
LADYRRPIGQIIRSAARLKEARAVAVRRRLLRRETLATLMLGTASVALGIVMFMVTLLGLAGIPFRPWSEPRERFVETTPEHFVSAGSVFVPSPECDQLAWFGFALGGLGVALSLRRRKFSWLSAIGFSLMLLMMLVVVACDSLMILRP